MKTSDFWYDLPEELIAQTPVEPRDHSRLMVVHRGDGTREHKHFYDIIDYLKEGDCLVLNNSKVLPARMFGVKEGTGAKVEFLLIKRIEGDTWETMVRPGKRLKVGDSVLFGAETDDEGRLIGPKPGKLFRATVKDYGEDGTRIVEFEYDGIFMERLEELGEMPLPPYIDRRNNSEDKDRYQTVYCKNEGSVAAPTAGLHFTPEVISALHDKGIKTMELTLHVGAGTFQPVKAEEIGGHAMHAEKVEVSKEFIKNLIENLGNIVAVGTTSVRTLESLYYLGVQLHNGDTSLLVNQWEPYENASTLSAKESLQAILNYMEQTQSNVLYATTQIMIVPGYKFNIVNVLITNFHQPKSTLLLLLAAFVGEKWRELYEYALNNDYRFLSYGDSSVLIP